MKKKTRFAVVGLGHIAQVAVLPAFENTRGSAVLAALVSSDPAKLRKLGKAYSITSLYSYEGYDECLKSGDVDAVYIALPNHLHAEFTIRAAEHGIHVVCEKPMAVTARDCLSMIRACEAGGVRLMIAYRLHFEKANLSAIELVRSGKIGEPRLFSSIFTLNVRDGNIRLRNDAGGGPLFDIGIYCLNAARYLFGSEPIEVLGMSASGDDPRFGEVEEIFSASIRFPGERIASFVCSFGSPGVGEYRVVGTKGSIRLDPAFEYRGELHQYLSTGSEPRQKTFGKSDQFAAEIAYFAGCVQRGVDPEPSGWEGYADVRVIEALYRSAGKSRAISLPPFVRNERPTLEQRIKRPAVNRPAKPVHARPPTQ